MTTELAPRAEVRTSFGGVPDPASADLTPAMRQYATLRRKHADCVLFFRMGDFYELFWGDAELAHRELGITLTQRSSGIPMAGVPFHALEGYLRRMIRAGHRVAVCEQMQDPADAKGVVERAVTRILTPGTLVDEELLDETSANRIAAVWLSGADGPACVAVAEISTGQFEVFTVHRAALADELLRLSPSELLAPDALADDPIIRQSAGVCELSVTRRPDWTFRSRDAEELLRKHYRVHSLEAYGLHNDDAATSACGALLRYLQETQDPGAGDRPSLGHLAPPRRLLADAFVVIDAVSLRSLEIERTMRSGGTDGSLITSFERCVTSMGRRTLRDWLCFPLRDPAAILRRQDAVRCLVDEPKRRAALRGAVAQVQDVARITGRIAVRRATPRDVVAMGSSAAAAAKIAEALRESPQLEPFAQRLAGLRGVLDDLAETIAAQCITDGVPAHLRAGGLFRDGFDEILDDARSLCRDGDAALQRYQQSLAEETGIASLKVAYNKVFGHYIEITNVHRDRVPPSLTRKQTLKNAERYITGELHDLGERILSADLRALEREQELFAALLDAVADVTRSITAFAALVCELDVLVAFAETAARRGHVAPTLTDEPILRITAGRHPVLDGRLGDGFVPNDCRLDGGTTLALITGPNMAGKSTYIRQTALITLLAHTGAFVPAESAEIGLVDRIFTRIGASDELHEGQSTFMVEMTETANILHHATKRSLVVLDEIGRGTSTLDGLALAWAIAETISAIGCRTLFATHYHELTQLADQGPGITNLNVTVREWGDDIVFLHKIEPGRADRSYGIHVARIAGLPGTTVSRAREVLNSLTVHTHAPAPRTGAPPPEPDLFTRVLEHPVVDRLRDVNIESLTPLAAFDLLRSLRDEARET